MGSNKRQWWISMLRKHGSEEAVREYMKETAKKASHPGTGGFRHLKANDPTKLKELSSKGGKNSKRGKAKRVQTEIR